MTRKQQIVAVAAIVAFGGVVRLAHLGHQSLWFDEGYTAWAINHRPAQIIRLIRADTNPPLFYLLLHYWTHLFGRSEAGLRSLSAVAGILQIPIVFLIALRLLGRGRAAIFATLFFCLSFLQYWYCREARFYELICLFTAVAFYCLLRRWLIPLSLSLALGLYTHNMMLAQLPAFAIAAVLLRSLRPKEFGIVSAIVGLLYAPWLVTLLAQARRIQQGFWLGRPTWNSVASDIAGLCGVRHLWTWDHVLAPLGVNVVTFVPSATIAILCCAFLLAMLLLKGERRRVALALFTLALLPPLLTAAWSLVATPIFMMKLFVFSTIPLGILIAAPLAWARPAVSIPWIIFAVILYAANDFSFIHEQANEDWRSAARYVESQAPGHARLLIFCANEGQLPFDYYFTPSSGDRQTGLPRGFFSTQPPRTLQRVLSDSDLDGLRRDLGSGRYDSIILIYAHSDWADPARRAIAMLTARYPGASGHDFHGVEVWQFAAR